MGASSLHSARPKRSADALIRHQAAADPDAVALWRGPEALSYGELDHRVDAAASALRQRCPLRGSRIAVWLDKRFDTVVWLFAAMRAGHVALPVNPALRPAQVAACLSDAGAALLVSDSARLAALDNVAGKCTVDVIDVEGRSSADLEAAQAVGLGGFEPEQRSADELAILFYTSGSTGAPKGVMVTHTNLLAGATSVASYLQNRADDRLLAALPLSFDAGFSQLSTAFAVGASVVLLDHLFASDVARAIDEHAITGLTAVPPLYLQLLATSSNTGKGDSLRYFANTGGHLPRSAWQALRARWPKAQPIAMYGLTEAFRASWLPPFEFDQRPDSMGIAIPGARLHVLRADGSRCAPDEPGELVQQGSLVTRGYWNDPARSAERFRAGPDGEPAVWSGDTVRQDADGYLYFVARRDEQIKTSGYRVSPTEVESAAAALGVPECVAVGVPDPLLGEAIVLVVGQTPAAAPDVETLLHGLRGALASWQVPRSIDHLGTPLPRNANGKFDRMLIRSEALRRHRHD